MRKSNKIIISIIAIFAFLAASLAILPTTSTYAAVTADICSSNAPDDIKAANGCGGNSKQLPDAVTNILNAVIGGIGIVAVIFIVVGGVHYMTSAGDPGKIEKAKKTILYAVIGLIICALAFAITNFAITILNQA